jgi:hypothetical protein
VTLPFELGVLVFIRYRRWALKMTEGHIN